MWCTHPTKQGTSCTDLFWDMGTWKINNSPIDFWDFCFFTFLICFLSPPCNLWVIIKHFPQKKKKKKSVFSAASHIQTIGIGILNLKIWFLKNIFNFWFLKITLPDKPLIVFYTNVHTSKSRRSMDLILVSNLSWKCAPYNDIKNIFYPKYHLHPVL